MNNCTCAGCNWQPNLQQTGPHFVTGLTTNMPKTQIVLDEFGSTSTFDVPDAACDCPANDYLTVIRVMASEIEALEREADAVRDVLAQVLDYVRWADIPESLCDAIDAELDGNTADDEDIA